MGPVREEGWGKSRKGAPATKTEGKEQPQQQVGKGERKTGIIHQRQSQNVSSLAFNTVFLEKKTELVHGRGAFSSPNSCWRSTSLSVRGCARIGVPSVAPG